MTDTYENTRQYWNRVFAGFNRPLPDILTTGVAELDESIRWLGSPGNTVLDFGFGSGLLLMIAAREYSGTYHGIELSEEACRVAKKLIHHAGIKNVTIEQGAINQLQDLPAESFDAVILSNVVDNMLPKDGITVLSQTHRILKPGGKVFFKVNDHVSDETARKHNFKCVQNDVYLEPSGLYLWNLDTVQWRLLLERWFALERELDVYIAPADQTNRLFLVTKTTAVSPGVLNEHP